MIYTLTYLKERAEGIASHWNGESERYTDAFGDTRTEDDASAAKELVDTLKKVEELISELNI